MRNKNISCMALFLHMKRITLLLLFISLCIGENGSRYLIITHDDFYEAIQPLAQWKTKKGLKTKIVKLSEIGSDSTQIRNYIINAYNNWTIKPEYLLLVGAPNFIPFARNQVTGWGAVYTDNYYTNMDGDIYNEILSGRLTVHDTIEAKTVVNKILLYERIPNIQDSLWFRKACLIYNDLSNAESIYISDVYYAAKLMINNGYVTIDTFHVRHGGNNNAQDVINAVNNGRAFVMYRGLGTNNWYSPFAVQPDLLENGSMLPIVLSITCLTIGTGSVPAIAEKWLLTGTPTQPRGAAGYFASTTAVINAAYLRSAVAKGFFYTLFVDRKIKFGEVCEGGRLRVYQMYPSPDGLAEYYGFTTLGDPEMNLWTSTPKQITVLHDSTLYVGNETLNVQVTYSGAPVESAYVCAMLDTSIYEIGYTDETGNLIFELYLPNSGNLELTITGMNLYPQEITIPIINMAIKDNKNISDNLELITIYPNPSRAKTTISFYQAISKPIKLFIYDVSGRLIKEFNQVSNQVIWDGTDNIGCKVSKGIYFVCLEIGGYRKTKKVILLK